MKGKAQYPFGYGLTYGDVSVADASVVNEADEISVLATVVNKGNTATKDVVQVYVKCLDSEYAVTNPQLSAFTE